MTLKVDEIQNTTGGAVTLTNQAAAKGFANYTTVTTTAIRDSLNVTSLTDDGTGQTTVTYASNYANTDYIGVMYTNGYGNTTDFGINQAYGFATRTTSTVAQRSYTGSNVDSGLNDHIIMGDLA